MLEVSTVLNWEYVEYAVAFFIVVLALLIARICVYIFEKYLEHFASKTESKLDDMIIEAIKRPVYLLTILIGVYFALNSIEFQYMNDAVIFFKIFGISLTTWVVYSLTDAIIKEYGYALAERTESDIDDVIIPVIDQIAGILIIVLGVLSILNLLGIKITPILAGMGVAGIAVALAAQETLSNMFSGFTLMMDRPFKIGDRIVLDSGELCEVRDIGLRSTRLYDVIDHAMITMPNSDVSNMKITNISMPD
ncbi:MAG: mechanosensitive ion channel, partial [Halobacteriota archaeon]|nr:mechanosensitive ion channel [Halobacteriota archaeon]